MALPQPLHIARKDLLHLWPETLVVLLLFAAFCWAAPSGWSGSQYAGVATLLAAFLKGFLMPISWLVLISRLIHDEPLVGDRQFWTSRPYHWAKLLAAKAIYLGVFLYVPFLLMQIFLLKRAGLYPTTVVPALLHNLLLLTAILVVPLTAIAAVTATFARMLLSTIGAMIYLLIVGLGLLYLIFRRMPPPGFEPLVLTLIVLLPLAALIYQYATRRTPITRILLLGTPLLIALLLVIVPATALIRRAYPVAGAASDPKLAPVPAQLLPKTAPTGALQVLNNMVEVGIPVATSGIDEQSNYTVKGYAVTLDAPGQHWVSPYLNELGTEINAYQPGVLVPVALPLDVFNQFKSTPVDVHLSLAADHLKLDSPTTWRASAEPFSVPGHGRCSWAADNPEAAPICRFPFAAPQPDFVSARLPASSCGDPESTRTPHQMNLVAGSSTLDFDPVVTVPLSFPASRGAGPAPHPLCPGTPLAFSEAKAQGKVRLEVDLHGLQLDPLAARFQERGSPLRQ